MTDFLNKSKSKDSLITEYLNSINAKCETNMPTIIKKPNKVSDDCLKIPTIKSYNDLIYNNYNVSQLKTFAKHYKLKQTGNKPQLTSRVWKYAYMHKYELYAILHLYAIICKSMQKYAK